MKASIQSWGRDIASIKGMTIPLQSSELAMNAHGRCQIEPVTARYQGLIEGGAAAEGLKQSRGISVAIGSRLRPTDHRLLKGLLCTQQRQVAHCTELILSFGDREGRLGQRGCTIGGSYGIGIGGEGAQGIGYVLECREYRRAILRAGLVERRTRGALAMQQRAAGEQGLRQACSR